MKGRARAVSSFIRSRAAGICLFGLFAIAFFFVSAKERRIMNISPVDIRTSGAMPAAVPPIDAVAPARTETATFALG